MNGIIFVIDEEVDTVVINSLLSILAQSKYHQGNTFHVVTTRSPSDTNPSEVQPTLLGFYTQSNPFIPQGNAWSNATISDVESFALTTPHSLGLFLVLDAVGVADKTIILSEQHLDDDFLPTKLFKKVRVAWSQAWSLWANLEIANMSFEEFCTDEIGDEEGWYKPSRMAQGLPPLPKDSSHAQNKGLPHNPELAAKSGYTLHKPDPALFIRPKDRREYLLSDGTRIMLGRTGDGDRIGQKVFLNGTSVSITKELLGEEKSVGLRPSDDPDDNS